jgi:hypothetical protein
VKLANSAWAGRSRHRPPAASVGASARPHHKAAAPASRGRGQPTRRPRASSIRPCASLRTPPHT